VVSISVTATRDEQVCSPHTDSEQHPCQPAASHARSHYEPKPLRSISRQIAEFAYLRSLGTRPRTKVKRPR
jgi:hypothetical protein